MTASLPPNQPDSRAHHYIPDVFNDAASNAPPVSYKLSPQEIERRKVLYHDYYNQQVDNIRQYCRDKEYEVAIAFLDVLLAHKGDGIRKDGYTPDYGHEVDLVLSCISDIESGQFNIQVVEAKYGSLESLIISAIAHDLGEDFGLMPDDIQHLAYRALNERIGASISQRHMQLIYRGVQSMERLTHDRHYSIDDFVEQFGDEFLSRHNYTLEIPNPEPGQLIDLSDDIKSFLWDKMDIIPPQDKGNFQAFLMQDKKGKPRITVTRYGKENGWGADWNAYSNGFMSDVYDATVKFEDSANGMASRLSIESFTADGGNRYLRKRAQLFDLNDAAGRMIRKYPEMGKNFRSIGCMMGIAYTMGRILLNHDPRMNDVGESGFSAENLATDQHDVIHIDLKNFPEFAFDSYSLVPGLSHPVARFMHQYRDVIGFYSREDEKASNPDVESHPWYNDVKYLYEQMRIIIILDCSKPYERNGLNICDLIDNPETIDPFPRIFEKINNDRSRPAPEPY